MPVTTYLPAKHFQYWQEALDEKLLELVAQANDNTPNAPWRVRLKLAAIRLRWWHLRKTTVYFYQVLVSDITDDEAYQIPNLGNFQLWNSRDLVFAFFVGYNTALQMKNQS